jgi:hypothetical protein
MARRLAPYPSGLMAEFQWWLLLVGLVAGGGLVAIVSMDGRRREEDLADIERRAEATWIAERLITGDGDLDPATVESVLGLHREYLSLPPPDHLFADGVEVDTDGRPIAQDVDALDGDPDRMPDEVGDDGRGGPDEHLAPAGEEHPATGEKAHAGADREQRGE